MSDKIVNLLQQENVSLSEFSWSLGMCFNFVKRNNLYFPKNQIEKAT